MQDTLHDDNDVIIFNGFSVSKTRYTVVSVDIVFDCIVTRYGFNSRIICDLIISESSANQSAFNKVILELNALFVNYT